MIDAKPLPYVPGSTTLAVLPDTQGYSARHPHLFVAQTEWIARMRDERRIAYVLHLGDIVDDPDDQQQWRAARTAMARLDGVVPYAIAPGNHDYHLNGAGRETLLNTFFDASAVARWPTCGGLFEPGRLDSSCHLFEAAGGRPWMVLALEWGPRDAVVAWANELLVRHADRMAVITTHAYLYSDGTRYDHTTKDQEWNLHRYAEEWGHDFPGGSNDGEELWEKLVRRHANVVMTINGHVLNSGVARLSSAGDAGNVVHQMLVNYQLHENSGDGFMRLIEVLPDGRTAQVKSYSPALDRYRTDEANQFVLALTVQPGARSQAAR